MASAVTSALLVLVLLHQYGNLCLMPRDSSPALSPLAPKRQRVLCAHWRPPGLGRHGSRHANLARYPLHRYLRSSGAILARPPQRGLDVARLARVLDCCCCGWAGPCHCRSHIMGRRQASLGTPVPRMLTVAPGPKASSDLASRRSQGASAERRGPHQPTASVDVW